MREKINIILLPIWAGLMLCFLLLSSTVKGQEPQFSQFYASHLNLNPAFTGLTPQSRFTAIYRSQWSSIAKPFISTSLSYDHNIEKLNSGAGLVINYDRAGNGGLMAVNIGGVYAYEFKLKEKLRVRSGVKLSVTHRNYDHSGLLFADQIIRNTDGASVEPNLNQGVSYFDMGAGTLIYGETFWGGIAFNHINQPNQSLVEEESKLPVSIYLHAGYKFELKKKRFGKTDAETNITITANYKSQLKWDQFDVGVYFEKNFFTVGLWYRGIPIIKKYKPTYSNNEAIIALLGIYYKGIKVGYAHDFTVSKLGNIGGAKEISINYEFPREKLKNHKSFFCPKF